MRGFIVVLLLVAALFPLHAASASECRFSKIAVVCVGNESAGLSKNGCRAGDSGERFSGVSLQTYFGTPVIDQGNYKVGGATHCQGTAHVTYIGALWNTGSGISSGGIIWIEGPTCEEIVSVGARGISTQDFGFACMAGPPPDEGWGFLPVIP